MLLRERAVRSIRVELSVCSKTVRKSARAVSVSPEARAISPYASWMLRESTPRSRAASTTCCARSRFPIFAREMAKSR